MTQSIVRMTFCLLLLASGNSLVNAQTSSSTDNSPAPPVLDNGPVIAARQYPLETPAPFSHIAFGGGISSMGINLQTAVNLSDHLNLRGIGNVFNYTDSNISTNGFTVNGKLSLASAGIALDYFPFPWHGFRISPGMLLGNQNGLSGTMQAQGGTSFTLNNVTYYSSPSKPVTGVGSVGLHAWNPAPMLTVGWGNMIPRSGSHWSFPVEVGAAYTGEPALNIAFTSGQVCADKQGTVNCQNVVGNKDVNDNLQAQITKDRRNLAPLRFYPIVSFGASYSFRLP